MFLHVSIHRPHESARQDLIGSMHRYGDAIRGLPGLVNVGTYQTPEGRLVGLALWESREAWEMGRVAGMDAVKDDPFDEWESAPLEGWTADSV